MVYAREALVALKMLSRLLAAGDGMLMRLALALTGVGGLHSSCVQNCI